MASAKALRPEDFNVEKEQVEAHHGRSGVSCEGGKERTPERWGLEDRSCRAWGPCLLTRANFLLEQACSCLVLFRVTSSVAPTSTL